MSETRGLRLLSLDGGGLRGYSELFILQKIMQELKHAEDLTCTPKPCDYFDIIAGTSTGGFIAILLGRLRMSVEDAIKSYDNFMHVVFLETNQPRKKERLDATTLEAAARAIIGQYEDDEDASMRTYVTAGQQCKTFVCAMPTCNVVPHRFRSYDVPASRGSSNTKIWEVIRATTAAPAFFKKIFIEGKEFVDGGLGCQNPIEEILKEAHDLFGMNRSVSCVLNIGTGLLYAKRSCIFHRLTPTKLIQTALVNITRDAQWQATLFEKGHAECALQKVYFRFNAPMSLRDVWRDGGEDIYEVQAVTSQYLWTSMVRRDIGCVVDALKTKQKAK